MKASILTFESWSMIRQDTIALKAAEKKVEILVDVDPRVPLSINGDPTRLRQVLLNLMSNAVKFTAEGEVTVSVTHAALKTGSIRLHFLVADSGIGIADGAIDNLFTPFTQADSTTTRRYGGTGLGLSICRKLVSAMGGDITVQSTVGTGSVFSFSILSAPAQVRERMERPQLSQCPRVLLVVGNMKLRCSLQKQAERLGAIVRSAGSAADGLEAWLNMSLSDWVPEVVMVDNGFSSG